MKDANALRTPAERAAMPDAKAPGRPPAAIAALPVRAGAASAREAIAGAGPQPAPRPVPAPSPAAAARLRRRHLGLFLFFLLLVALPVGGGAVYLYGFAADQYASRVGFSVRREEAGAAIELPGGLAAISGTGADDADVLFAFIRSQPMVTQVDGRIDLRRAWGRPDDPVFALQPDASIEDLTRYWGRMVKVVHDSSTGLIELRVQAFDAANAQAIAAAVFDESSAMINRLSGIAREDATRHAREELGRAVARLVSARQALTGFRARSQLVDPQADLQGRMNLLNLLETRLIDARIELDLLRETTRANDPRVQQTERRSAALEGRIAAERARFGAAGGEGSGADYAGLLSEYERLAVDRDFAEQAYVAALAAHDAALAAARRQSRYLAAHIEATRAETAEYPRRPVLLALLAAFALILWAVLALGYYSIRDRR